MARLAIRSLFPVSRASSRRRVWPAQLRLTGARQPAAGALGAAVIALTVVAAVPLGVPAAPAWASTHCFTVIDNVVSDGDLCTGAVTIPKTVTSIGDFAFSGISVLTSVTFEEDSALQTIGRDAFAGSGLTSIVIPKSVTSIGDYAFFGISVLTSVTFEEDSALQTIGSDAFDGSGLTSIVIPKSVTSIGANAFSGISVLTSVTFEADSALQTIGRDAFAGSGLTSIVIPKSVTSISDYAFFYILVLTSVTFEGNAPSSVGTSAFGNVADGATANIGFLATGFGDGATWNGLRVVRAAAPLMPLFDTPVATVDGFTVAVTNYDENFGWAATSDYGTLTEGTPEGTRFEVVVTGLAPGQQATVTVTTTRVGYATGTATLTVSALGGCGGCGDCAVGDVQSTSGAGRCNGDVHGHRR